MARSDAELVEHLVQVVLDRAGADEEALTDLRVGQPVAGQGGNPCFLRRELPVGLHEAAPRCLTGGKEFAVGAFRESGGTQGDEGAPRGAQLRAEVDAPALTPEPLTLNQLRP